MLRVMGAIVLMWAAAAQAAGSDGFPAGQLPDTVTPARYAIDLTVVPSQATFTGEVRIEVNVKQPTDVIWLHGQDLTVNSVSVAENNAAPIQAAWSEIPKSDGVAKITLAKPLRGPKARITIRYAAPFNKQLEGIYRSDDGGQAYAFSQMEPISARFAFPSFDEPRFKTPFDISLTVRDSDAAISNTLVTKTSPAPGGMKRVQFATTKPLPTYLIAVAVGPFDVVDWQAIPKTALRDRVIPLRGITTKGKGSQIKFALANTAALLTELETYFGTPYPFDKLDIIAATDFSAGAMENAGAIVYREQLLLLDESSSLAQKRRYVGVHAHELAHQWFGNLVTPAWWNDIWLNEAFATWMSNKIAAIWDPKGEYGRLSLDGALGAMTADSKTNSRRIAQPIETNDDIMNAFDSITYQKGGGVLSMFEQFYGVDGFRKGVNLHMNRHAYGVATARDFLQSISDANKDTKGVAAFESFLNQPGVPLISAELHCTQIDRDISIKQSRYLPPLGHSAPVAQTQTWKVPLCISYGSGASRQQTCSLIEDRTTRIKLKTDQCPAWIMPNADGAGYYRFALTKKDWTALVADADTLTDKEMLAAFDSLSAGFKAGEIDAGDYLDHIKALAARKGGVMAWDMAASMSADLVWVKDVLVSPATAPGARKFIADIYGPLFAKIGLDPTSDLDRANAVQATLLRGPVVSMVAVQAGLQPARGELAKRGAAYVGVSPDGKAGDGKIHPDAVNPNMIDVALRVAVQDLGAPVVDAIFALLKTERDGTIRGRLLGALTRSTNPATAAKVRDLALSPTLRVNEVPAVVFGSMNERDNTAAAWAWFKANFDAIKARTPQFNQGDLAGIGRRFCTAAERDDYKSFIEPKLGELTGAPRNFEAALETINHCAALVEKQRANAEAYLARR